MSYHDDVGKFIAKKLWDWKVPVTADFISVLSLAFPLVAFFYFDTHILLAAFLWYTGRALDYLDGNYARISNTVTDHGRYFDAMIGVVTWILLYISIPVQFPLFIISLAVIIKVYSHSIARKWKRRFEPTSGSLFKETWFTVENGCLPAFFIIPFAFLNALDIFIYLSIMGNLLYLIYEIKKNYE
jgi:phosphatidylglycerophosphate synthase|tara:strand:+ start:124 stop:678 length:555 start_codon:yes stop_codon:yes gene_type:complete